MLTREQLTTDKIFKNKTDNWYVRIVHIGSSNLIFQYSGKLEDLINGLAQEDSGSIKDFCEKFGIYDPPKRPERVTMFRYVIVSTKHGDKEIYSLTPWTSRQYNTLEKEELNIIKEFSKEVEL